MLILATAKINPVLAGTRTDVKWVNIFLFSPSCLVLHLLNSQILHLKSVQTQSVVIRAFEMA